MLIGDQAVYIFHSLDRDITIMNSIFLSSLGSADCTPLLIPVFVVLLIIYIGDFLVKMIKKIKHRRQHELTDDITSFEHLN